MHETLLAASEYLKALKKLDSDVKKAELQILDTSKESASKIEVMFTSLLEAVTDSLNARKTELINKIDKVGFSVT